MAGGVKTIWTDLMDKFLIENYQSMTNSDLAKKLNLKLTITRNRLRELGLKRIEMEYWTDDQINFLISNYKKIGDVEIAEYFEMNFPKLKLWRKEHIRKKRVYLNLHRTAEEIKAIASTNSSPGGNSFTIGKNSSSLNMAAGWVVQQIAWRNSELQKELLKYPEIIDLKRSQLKLNREIKIAKDGGRR